MTAGAQGQQPTWSCGNCSAGWEVLLQSVSSSSAGWRQAAGSCCRPGEPLFRARKLRSVPIVPHPPAGVAAARGLALVVRPVQAALRVLELPAGGLGWVRGSAGGMGGCRGWGCGRAGRDGTRAGGGGRSWQGCGATPACCASHLCVRSRSRARSIIWLLVSPSSPLHRRAGEQGAPGGGAHRATPPPLSHTHTPQQAQGSHTALS